MNELLYILKIVSDKKKGTVFEIRSPKISIGRSVQADAVLDFDPTCSRYHATIRLLPEGLFLENRSEKSHTFLNNKKISRPTKLRPTDQFTVGKTTLEILFKQQISAKPNLVIKSKKLNFKLLIAVGAILLFSIYFLNQNTDKKSENEISKPDIKLIEEKTQKLIQEHEQLGLQTETYKKAQKFYIQGFRDFKKGQFERATRLFQSCLALEPTHVLCNRYVTLSQRKFSEIIQYHIVLGRKYLKQYQNQSCVTTFKNVMIMVKNTKDPLYKEAEANWKLCKARLQGKY